MPDDGPGSSRRRASTCSIIGPTFPYKGGIAQHTTELAHRMKSAGHDVTIESWRRQYPERLYPGQQRLDRADLEPFGQVHESLSWNRPDSWVRVGRQVSADSDLIVLVLTTPVQYPIYHAIITAARARKRRPTIIGIAHNVLPHEAKRFDPALVRSLLKRLDGVVTHSDGERERATGLGAQRTIEVELPFFFKSSTLPHARREQGAERRLCFVGFVRPYKGLDVLIDAVAASTARPSVVVRGEFWEDVSDYLDRIRSSGVQHLFDVVPGYVDDDQLVGVIDSCDALVLPYRSATGTVLPRIAFSRGSPVITTDVGDLAIQVTHDMNGLVCAPGDAQSLASAIDRFYADDCAERLRRGVCPPDIDSEWRAYLQAIDRVAQPR